MGFGNIGIGELMVILLVVMIVFGPKRLPEIARNMGKFMRDFRRETNAAIRELQDGIEPIKVGIFDEPDAVPAAAADNGSSVRPAPLPGVSAAGGAGVIAASPDPVPGNGARKPAAGRKTKTQARATAKRKTSATAKKRPAQKPKGRKSSSSARSGAARKR